MDEDGFIGKDEVVMQVERGRLWMECSIPKKRVGIFQDLWKVSYPELNLHVKAIRLDSYRRQSFI
jgi:hypothetical protein